MSRVSLVPNFTLKTAVTTPYSPAASMAARHMSTRVSGSGSRGPAWKATAAAATAPRMNCPSPPMFQNRILKARDRATEVTTRGTNTFR